MHKPNQYLFILPTTLLLSCFVHADLSGKELDDFSLEELGTLGLSNTPQTVATSTATKTSQTTTVSPSVVRILTAEDIRNYGYKTLGEVLAGIPGLYTTWNGLNTYLGVRGLGRPGDYNTRILVLIDGIRVNENFFDSALVGREIPLDVDLIDRVEYAPGPGSAVYGKNAFFGVINIITKNGNQLDGFEFSGSIGTHDTTELRMSYGQRLKNGGEFLASVTGFQNEDVTTPMTMNYGTYTDDSDKNITFLTTFSYQTFQTEIIYGQRTTDFVFAPFDYDNEYEEFFDERLLINSRYSTTAGPHWLFEVTGTLGKATYEEQFWSTYYTERYKYTGSWLTAEIKAINSSIENHRLLFGVEGHVDLNLQGSSTFIDEYGDVYQSREEDSYQSLGVFVQDEISLSESLTVLLGARLDFTDFEDEVNPRLGIIWQPNKKSTYKLLYGSAFRSPNFFEIIINSYEDEWGDYITVIPENEKIETYEAIVEHYFDNAFKVAGSLYFYRIEDIIEYDFNNPSQINGIPIHAYGLELEAEKRFSNGIKLHGSYCIQRTEDNDNNRLSNSPTHLVQLKSTAPLWFGNGNISGELRYVSDRLTEDGETLDDYLLGNITLTYDLAKNVNISASVYNIGDTTFNNPQDFSMERGRSFFFKVTTGF